jgi:hypothetical protein
MTKDDLEIIEKIKNFARENSLFDLEDSAVTSAFFTRIFDIPSSTYSDRINNPRCKTKTIKLPQLGSFMEYCQNKIENPKDSEFMYAFASNLFLIEDSISYQSNRKRAEKAVKSFKKTHSEVTLFLVGMPPVFIFTNSDDVLQDMLSLVFESENKVKNICIVVNDFTMDTVRAIQRYKELAKSENLKIDGMNLNLYRSKNTIFYNIVASQREEEFIGLLFNENEYVELSEIGRYLICQEMNLDNFEHIGSESSIKFFNHFN